MTDGKGHLKYEPEKRPSKVSAVSLKKAKLAEFDRLSTGYIVWHLVLRHKVGLLVTYGVFMTITWMFPEWYQVFSSLVH